MKPCTPKKEGHRKGENPVGIRNAKRKAGM